MDPPSLSSNAEDSDIEHNISHIEKDDSLHTSIGESPIDDKYSVIFSRSETEPSDKSEEISEHISALNSTFEKFIPESSKNYPSDQSSMNYIDPQHVKEEGIL
jgi:hypothetical protein